MKKYILPVIISLALILAGCATNEEAPVVKEAASDKIQIVATLFPQYDFAREVAGDKAEVTLLLPPGMESHSFEPTHSDIIKINDSDLFIFTGEYMEIWSQKIIDGMESSNSKSLVLDISKGIELVGTETVGAEHIHEDKPEHAHEAGLDHNHDHDRDHDHDHIFDPHIWTDPLYAKIMTNNVLDALCSIDPLNREYYENNAARYSGELDALHEELQRIVWEGNRSEIMFGSRFALYYFAKRYDLTYYAAFDSCSSETEPSVKRVAELIDKIKEENIKVIYYAELEDPKVARSISSETGAKMLLFHSCHNVTKEEFENGATYLSLMRQNAENLREGLK